MKILGKVRAVEKLYQTLDKDIFELRNQTGISCVENCVKCCTTPRIEATALEFYPLAYHLYKTGEAENVLTQIDEINDPTICPILNHLSFGGKRPGCTQYEHRGLICRLFTYSYGTDKYGVRRINACKTIRVEQPQQLDAVNKILQVKPLGPKTSNYYSQLQAIDFNEAHRFYPIGNAIKVAIEKIITNYHYSGNKAI